MKQPKAKFKIGDKVKIISDDHGMFFDDDTGFEIVDLECDVSNQEPQWEYDVTCDRLRDGNEYRLCLMYEYELGSMNSYAIKKRLGVV